MANDRDTCLANILHEDDIVPITSRGTNRGARRVAMTNELESIGVQRPGYAMVNSRAN
jgi:hypothetical protein